LVAKYIFFELSQKLVYTWFLMDSEI